MVDDVSIVSNTYSSTQFLINPTFADSSSSLVLWNTWCPSTCGAGSASTIVNSNCRITGNCYKSQCRGGTVDYLVQRFWTVVGERYIISFWFQRVRVIPGT
ncbi:unnamed protein product, partial [Rotaria magnacalcarata]